MSKSAEEHRKYAQESKEYKEYNNFVKTATKRLEKIKNQIAESEDKNVK